MHHIIALCKSVNLGTPYQFSTILPRSKLKLVWCPQIQNCEAKVQKRTYFTGELKIVELFYVYLCGAPRESLSRAPRP